MQRWQCENLGINQESDADAVHQFTEVGRIDTKIISEVFVRHKLKDVRAARQELTELFFRCKTLQFYHALQ